VRSDPIGCKQQSPEITPDLAGYENLNLPQRDKRRKQQKVVLLAKKNAGVAGFFIQIAEYHRIK
jgi:hypothetical protein